MNDMCCLPPGSHAGALSACVDNENPSAVAGVKGRWNSVMSPCFSYPIADELSVLVGCLFYSVLWLRAYIPGQTQVPMTQIWYDSSMAESSCPAFHIGCLVSR